MKKFFLSFLFVQRKISKLIMQRSMCASIRKEKKIFNSIVTFNFINMVNNFFRSKVTTNMFFHNQAMLKDVTSAITIRMIMRKIVDIVSFSTWPFYISTFPVRMLFSFFKGSAVYNVFSFIPRGLSYLKNTITFIGTKNIIINSRLCPTNHYSARFARYKESFSTFYSNAFSRTIDFVRMFFVNKNSFALGARLFHVFILALLINLCQTNSALCADEWDKTEPAGTTLINDIDTIIAVNNNAIDRVLTGFRTGAEIVYDSTSQITVNDGQVVCTNSGDTVKKLRSNTSNTTVTWSDIDTGAEASDTTYYLYAVCDADATTFTVSISTSASTPTGDTYYLRLGSFYNNASSNISMLNNDNNLNEFGAYVSKNADTTYTAEVDTIVIAYHNVGGNIFGIVNGATITRTSVVNNSENTLTFPVRAGDAWSVTNADNIKVLPMQ